MPIAYMNSVFQLPSLHYRLRLGGLYIVNAGRSFTMAWKAVSNMLPASTLKKMMLFGASVTPERLDTLDREVGLDCIEESFGGRRKGVMDNSSSSSSSQWVKEEETIDRYFDDGYWGQYARTKLSS